MIRVLIIANFVWVDWPFDCPICANTTYLNQICIGMKRRCHEEQRQQMYIWGTKYIKGQWLPMAVGHARPPIAWLVRLACAKTAGLPVIAHVHYGLPYVGFMGPGDGANPAP